VPELVRPRIDADLARRDRNDLARAKARTEQVKRLTAEEDDRVIARMNAERVDQGKEPLSERQEASVRGSRRNRRASQP
jgi:hypothetical protein